MKRIVTPDYLSLKKSISKYAEKYPAPNRKQNIDWLTELKALDENSTKYKRLRDKIVLSNGGFAMKYVMRYMNVLNDTASVSELFQEATIGVIEAIDTFDVSKKTSFTTYAYFHIRKRIIHFIRHNKLIRAPRDIARNLKHVSEAKADIQSRRGHEPTVVEIQEELAEKKDINLKLSIIDDIIVLLELNSSGYEDSFVSEYKDQIGTEEESELFRDMELNILTSIASHSQRIQKMIELRFGIGREFPHSPEEVKLMMETTEEEEQVLS